MKGNGYNWRKTFLPLQETFSHASSPNLRAPPQCYNLKTAVIHSPIVVWYWSVVSVPKHSINSWLAGTVSYLSLQRYRSQCKPSSAYLLSEQMHLLVDLLVVRWLCLIIWIFHSNEWIQLVDPFKSDSSGPRSREKSTSFPVPIVKGSLLSYTSFPFQVLVLWGWRAEQALGTEAPNSPDAPLGSEMSQPASTNIPCWCRSRSQRWLWREPSLQTHWKPGPHSYNRP